MKPMIWAHLAVIAALFLSASPAFSGQKGCVILIHGLARSAASMEVASLYLKQSGYAVEVLDYPSTRKPLPSLAREFVSEGRLKCAQRGYEAPFALTHSMGGILLRYWSHENPTAQWAGVVMLAPPNQGSELVDHFARLAPFRWINGPAGISLKTEGKDSIPSALGPVPFPLGVVAGTRSLNPIYSNILPGPDDGKVTVAATRVEGMKAHMTVPLTHTFLMNNPTVLHAVLSFFETGRFE